MCDKNSGAVYAAVDLEGYNNTGVNGIGLAVGNHDGVTLKKGVWWITLPEGEKVDARVQREFYDKNPEVEKAWKENSLPEEDQWKDFQRVFDSIGAEFGVEDRQVRLLSDNPAYDFANPSRYLKKYCDRGPLRYTASGAYRSVTDLSDSSWYLGIPNETDSMVRGIQAHDHMPDNDAEFIYLKTLVLSKVYPSLTASMKKELVDIAKEKVEEIVKNREACARKDKA